MAAQRSERELSQEYSWLALALAGIAGAVDGIGYLLLYHVFTSHMSGNTVAMMLSTAQGNWRETWRHLEPVIVFFFGIVVGLSLSEILVALRVARIFAIVAGTELLLLVIFIIVAHPPQQWMVVWPACAMGIQNAMLRRVGHHRVRTTFITGMLTNTAQGLVAAAHAWINRSNQAREKLADFAFYGSIWLCFACGGIFAAFLALKHGTQALLLPIGALAILVAYDIARPVTRVPLQQAKSD
jgi:uncharacterized membrane protein YoaK (UPF0700 family)